MDEPTPRLSYLVCATPRSGSTLLCDVLTRTGVAGRPREYWEALPETGLPRQPRQYLPDLDDPELEPLLPPVRTGPPLPPFPRRLVEAVAAGTTPNGVFGAKVMWGYLQPVLDGLGDAPERALPDLHWVLVRRRDKLRQAVSLWRAIQSQEWSDEGFSSSAPRDSEPVYSAGAIDALQAQLTEQEEAWERWLDARGADALLLDYEEYADAPQGAVAAVLGHLGVPVPEGGLPASTRLRRQSDELNEAWVRRHGGRARV